MNRTSIWVLLAVAALVYGARLGFPDFWGNHWESRRALISRTMLESGDWVVPRQNGSVTLNKPPLYYWTTAGAMAVLDNRDAFAARLPSVAAALAGLVLTWRLGILLGGSAAGLLSVLFLFGNALYFAHARIAEMDMMLLAVETGAVWAFLHARESGTPLRWALLGWGLAAAGFMIKGPVGIALPVTVVLVYRIADARAGLGFAPGWVRPGLGVPLFLMLVVPWFAAVLLAIPDAWFIFNRETLTRFGGTLDHREPFWFYLPVVLGGFLPGSVFFPVWWREARGESGGNTHHLRRLALAALVLLVFFSLSGSKRVYYVLPLWPLLAVGTGTALAAARRRGVSRRLWIPPLILSGALAMAALAAALAPEFGGPPFFQKSAFAYGLLGGVIAAAVWGIRDAAKTRWIRALVAVSAAMILGNLFVIHGVGPVSNAYRSRAGFAATAAARVPAGAPLYQFRQTNFALAFYGGRDIPGLRDETALADALERGGPLYLVVTPGRTAALERSGFRLETELEASWSPPGRPQDLRKLTLARVLTP